MDIVWNSINQLVEDSKHDPELREWFKSVNAYIRKVLLEPGFVLDPACNDDARALRDSGRQFYDHKYKSHFDNLFSSVGDFFRAMGAYSSIARFQTGADAVNLCRRGPAQQALRRGLGTSHPGPPVRLGGQPQVQARSLDGHPQGHRTAAYRPGAHHRSTSLRYCL